MGINLVNGGYIAGSGQIASGAVDLTKLSASSQAQGDVIYFNGTAWVRQAAGTSGQFQQTQGAGANPQWASSAVVTQFSSVQLSGIISTTSASLVDMTGVTLTITVGNNNCLCMFQTVDTNTTLNAVNTYEINVAGSSIGGTQTNDVTGGYYTNPCLIVATKPAAGSTTFKVQWKTTNSTAKVCPSSINDQSINLTVIEFKL